MQLRGRLQVAANGAGASSGRRALTLPQPQILSATHFILWHRHL
jgi:hypothetical protein